MVRRRKRLRGKNKKEREIGKVIYIINDVMENEEKDKLYNRNGMKKKVLRKEAMKNKRICGR